MTKRAQIPFSTWLPLAIAAPTPVSSLVHSSTLVTAGIYIIIRLNYIFRNNLLKIILIISRFTIFFSGLSANFEFDLKKIIALSTLRQLGLIIFILRFKLPLISFFHLIIHAIFKSLLFLCSGIIIHNFNNNQDIRLISLNNFYSPSINFTFLIASLTLRGIPFLTGFYSKDLIIEIFNIKIKNYLIYFIIYLSIRITISYSLRLLYYLNSKILKNTNFNNSNLNRLINKSILILIILTIFFGSIINWTLFNSINLIFLPLINKIIIFLFLILGITINFLFIKINFFKKKILINFYKFNNLIFFIPFNFKKTKIKFFKLSIKILIIQDYGWNEYLISNKILFLINKNNYIKLNLNINIFILLIFISIIIIYIY